MKKNCCTKESCPRNRDEDNSSPISESPGNMPTANKATQMTTDRDMSSMSTDKMSMPPSKTADKSSEADFNRNNQNISPRQNKNNPSNTSQTSQLHTSSPCLCVNCLHQPTPIHHTNTSSSKPSKSQCTCEKPNSSSTSISSLSETFPIKLKLSSKPPQQRPIVVPSMALRPERLQPQDLQQNKPSDLFLSVNSPTNSEEYFSCSSDGAGDDDDRPVATCPIPKGKQLQDAKKNLIILQLLHEVVHLINEDNPIRDEAKRIAQVDPSPSIPKTMAPQALQPMPIKQPLAPPTEDNPIRDEAMRIAQVDPSPSIPKTMAPHALQPMPIKQPLAPPTETSLDQCFCDGEEQTPKNEKVTPSENQIKQEIEPIKTEPKPSDDILCICPKPTDICPKHGPFANLLKLEPNPPIPEEEEEEPICICPTDEIDCPLHGRVKPHYIPDDIDGIKVKKEEKYDPYDVEFAMLEEKPLIDDQFNNDFNQLVPLVEDPEIAPYLVRTSVATGQNIYNFLPEFDMPDEQDEGDEAEDYFEQLGRYDPPEIDEDEESYFIDYECEEFDIECELAKERQAERYKKKKRGGNDRSPKPITDRTIATLQQIEGDGSPTEMKFFIDSLILDLDAMEHARRKSAVEKNICMPKPGMCPRKSFPVTITDVTDLGTTSLYVKWIIHDCSGIDGYEIFTDGYLTNRYYNGQHESAVITNVDVTIPHKIALLAQPSNEDKSIEQMYNREKSPGKRKSIPWKPDVDIQKKSCPRATSSLWTPSIYLYDPASCNAAAAPPLMRESK